MVGCRTPCLGCGSLGMPAGLFQQDTVTLFCWAGAGADTMRVLVAKQAPRIYLHILLVAGVSRCGLAAFWPLCSSLPLAERCGPVGRSRCWLLSACAAAAMLWRKGNPLASSCCYCCWLSSSISVRPLRYYYWPPGVSGCPAPAAASGPHGRHQSRRPVAQPRRPCFAFGRGTTC